MTDQQFLAGMWQRAEALQRQEKEIQRARQRNKRLRRRSVLAGLVALLLVAALAALLLLVRGAENVLYPLAFGLLCGGFVLDRALNTAKEEKPYEQPD